MTPTLLTEPTNEVLESICDAHWHSHNQTGGPAVHGVRFTDIHERDVVNHVLSGTVEVDGHTYGFVIENGNWNGTVVLQWDSDPENVAAYRPPHPGEPLTFIPLYVESMTLQLFAVYANWLKQPWFQDKVRGYLYDRHFAPGLATENHYRPWLAQKSLQLGSISELTPKVNALLLSHVGIDRSKLGLLTEEELIEAFSTP